MNSSIYKTANCKCLTLHTHLIDISSFCKKSSMIEGVNSSARLVFINQLSQIYKLQNYLACLCRSIIIHEQEVLKIDKLWFLVYQKIDLNMSSKGVAVRGKKSSCFERKKRTISGCWQKDWSMIAATLTSIQQTLQDIRHIIQFNDKHSLWEPTDVSTAQLVAQKEKQTNYLKPFIY